VKSGGALVVFPAGEVAHEETAGNANRTDVRWSAGVARLVQRTGADVVPVFFHGGNSRIFRLAGRIHPLLRTALLPRELLGQRGRTIRINVGTKITAARLARFEEPERLASYLRVRTSALAADAAAPQLVTASSAHAHPVAEPQNPCEIEREIQTLDRSRILVSSGAFDVLIARAPEIPRALLEIGRLREIAFRRAGEGTEFARDLDEFDANYWHLFAWNRERHEIAGAYRVGATDEIVPRAGIAGLYTSTLFRYDRRLLSQLDPALELGRAFVTPEYQRDYTPLLLLWKGIGAFVAANPRYRMLFGPVSISNSYQSLSRQILVRFLYATSYRQDLAELVSPRNPPLFLRHRGALAPIAGSIVRSLADVSTLLAEIESDRKGVPVLLRQYLKLNARLLGFNVDPSFGSVIDGLMLVDLTDVDRAILVRYMGAEPAVAFLRHHGTPDRRQAS
jgi:putative hemolysin